MESNKRSRKFCGMTATSLPVKMAACLPQDGDTTDPEKSSAFCTSQSHKQQTGGTQGGPIALSATSADINLEGDKAYEAVAKYDEEDLRNLLEEVTNVGKNKVISPYALALIRKEQDALREESSSDDGELALRHRNKKLVGRRDQSTASDQSAAARASTGGSLGSLHDSGEPKPKEGHNPGVASRCREGGSCGNLSRGSFETQPPRKRKGRKSRDAARASTSQREGGSLQNLSKSSEVASNHPKNLHKSGSLSQVCSEVTGARNKNRRQKTSSESSSCRYSRRSEDREAGAESSGDENHCHRLLPSPHSTLSTHSAEHPFPPEGVGGGASGVSTDWNNDIDDSLSDDATEGETTEEDEDKESSRGLGLSLVRNCSNEPIEDIEEDGIELQEVTVHRNPSDVDRGINFNLSRSQEDNMHGSCGRRSLPLQDSQCVNSVFKEEKPSSRGSDHDDFLGKRKLLTSRSDSASSENKSSLDENGNPIMGTSSSSSLLTSANAERPFLSHSVSRRNGLTAPHKEISRFDRLKAKSDKKKANKEKGVVNIKETPGFCGDQDLRDILKFLGAENETASTKGRKKHKNREEEKVKKRSKNNEKPDEERLKSEDVSSSKLSDEVNIVGNENSRSSKEKEDERKTTNNKKNKNENGKKNKQNSNLRESSSVEDLVSKSKQSDSVRDIRKQVTVDDGDMGLGGLHTYHANKKVDQLNNFIVDGKYLKESNVMDVHNDNDGDVNQATSEFVADFYSAGDSFLSADVSQTPSSPSGDFEIVSSKKRSKKYKSGSQTASQSSKSGGSDRWSGGSTSGSVYSDDNFRGNRFCPNKFNSRPNAFEKPQINFAEGPRTVHENMFLVRWSQYGVGERHGGDRYGATTSAPHSEDSDSDGDDSVHSMPVPSITPRPDVRKPPPSSGSTPQASYANIAKLAASANHAQMKRMSAASNSQSATVPMMELEKDSNINENEQSDLKSTVNESRPTNILDDNFPSLTESLGASSPPSAIYASKVGELRTNPLCENAMIPPKVASAQLPQTVDKPKDVNISGVCDGKSGSQESAELVPTAATSQEGPAKSPNVCPSSTSPPPLPHISHPHARYQPYQPHQPPPPPPPHIQPFQTRSHHYQNHKHNHHQNTQYGSSHNTPPLYYQYQRHNPFNRKDDDSPPNHRYPPPLRAPNSNHLNVVPAYPPPTTQPPPPHFKQSQFSQPPPPHVQQNNPQSQQNTHMQPNQHIQRSPQSAQNPHLQNQHFQEKPPAQHNLNTQQYPPLQSPYSSQNSQVPKPPHMQQNTLIQRNPQTHSTSNPNSNPLQSPPPVKNAIQQQNHHSRLNSLSQSNQHVEQTHLQKSPSPLENPPLQPNPSSQRQTPNSEQDTHTQSQNHQLPVQLVHSELGLQAQPDQHCSLPLPNSNPQSSPHILQQSPSPHPPSVVDASKEDISVHHANNLPVREPSEDRHLSDNKSQCKSSDPSRLKKLEPAVVFTDNAKFDHNVSGLEFGFGFDEPIVTSDSVSESDSILIDIKKSDNNVTKDFSKWFQAPKNDVVSYNYEELIRHVSNEWDKTLQLMEGDPKNVQYWRASSSTEA